MQSKIFVAVLVFLALGFLSSCGDGDSGSSSPPTVDVTDTWTGSWFSRNGVNGGSATLNATQSGASVTGSVSFSGSPCFASGAFSGSVSGNTVRGSITAGGIRVDVALTITGNSASGTYNSVSAGNCTGDSGTISLTTQPPTGTLTVTCALPAAYQTCDITNPPAARGSLPNRTTGSRVVPVGEYNIWYRALGAGQPVLDLFKFGYVVSANSETFVSLD